MVRANILLCRAMQFGNQLHSYNPPKWILRSQQLRSSLAGTEIDEGEFIELDGQTRHHLPKQCRIGRLIGRMKHSQQPRAPSHRAAGRVDAMLPVVLHVAVALPPALGRRLAHKAPQIAYQQRSRAGSALLPRLLAPPAAQRGPKLSGETGGHARMLTK